MALVLETGITFVRFSRPRKATPFEIRCYEAVVKQLRSMPNLGRPELRLVYRQERYAQQRLTITMRAHRGVAGNGRDLRTECRDAIYRIVQEVAASFDFTQTSDVLPTERWEPPSLLLQEMAEAVRREQNNNA